MLTMHFEILQARQRRQSRWAGKQARRPSPHKPAQTKLNEAPPDALEVVANIHTQTQFYVWCCCQTMWKEKALDHSFHHRRDLLWRWPLPRPTADGVRGSQVTQLWAGEDRRHEEPEPRQNLTLSQDLTSPQPSRQAEIAKATSFVPFFCFWRSEAVDTS